MLIKAQWMPAHHLNQAPITSLIWGPLREIKAHLDVEAHQNPIDVEAQ